MSPHLHNRDSVTGEVTDTRLGGCSHRAHPRGNRKNMCILQQLNAAKLSMP